MAGTGKNSRKSAQQASKRVWSPLQKEHLGRVEWAKEFGRRAIRDPELNELYAMKAARKPGLGAWHMAVSDAYHVPVIYKIEYPGNTPVSNDFICYVDKADLKEMRFCIISSTGEEIETNSVPFNILEGGWRGKPVTPYRTMQGSSLTIRVEDFPGNQVEETFRYPYTSCDISRGQQGKTSRRYKKSQLRSPNPHEEV